MTRFSYNVAVHASSKCKSFKTAKKCTSKSKLKLYFLLAVFIADPPLATPLDQSKLDLWCFIKRCLLPQIMFNTELKKQL